MGECFVCMDGMAPPSQCRCVGRYLHPECQQRLASVNGKVTCTVCAAPYGNVYVARRPTPTAYLFAVFVTCSVATQVLGCVSVATARTTDDWAVGVAAWCLSAMCAFEAFLVRYLALRDAGERWMVHRRVHVRYLRPLREA